MLTLASSLLSITLAGVFSVQRSASLVFDKKSSVCFNNQVSSVVQFSHSTDKPKQRVHTPT